jgi:hypothetical protein
MALSLARSRSAAAPNEVGHRALELWGSLTEAMEACAQAWAAARHYEDLRPKSGAALAQLGLKRSDLPRAAFDKLSERR